MWHTTPDLPSYEKNSIKINDPCCTICADLPLVPRDQLRELADELRAFVLDSVSQNRRAPQLQPGHGRAHGGAALRVQHPA
jgi:hypothetical protein